MSRLLSIPLTNPRLNTQTDPLDLRQNEFQVLRNFLLDKPGMLYKRPPMAIETTIADREWQVMEKWVNADLSGGSQWVVFLTDSLAGENLISLYNSAFGSADDLHTLAGSAGDDDTQFLQFGERVRCANGRTRRPAVIEALTRDFFWGTNFTYSDVLYDEAHPRDDDYSLGRTGSTASTGGTLTDATYYYKLVPVFDGNQEALLPEEYLKVDASGGGSDTNINSLTYTFDDPASNWNPRITSFQLYRATSYDGPYYRVAAINTADTDDPNLVTAGSAAVGIYFYAPDAAWTADEHNGSKLYVPENASSPYTIADTLTDILQVGTIHANTDWGAQGGMIVAGSVCEPNAGNSFGTNDFTDWTLTNGNISQEGGVGHYQYGSWGAKTVSTGSGNVIAQLDTLTVSASTVYTISVWLHDNKQIIVEYSVDGGGTWDTWVTGPSGATNSGEVKTGNITTGVGETALEVRLRWIASAGSQEAYWDSLYIGEAIEAIPDRLYGGQDVVVADGLTLDDDDGYADWQVLISTTDNSDTNAPRKTVTQNVRKAVQVDSSANLTNTTGQRVYLSQSYLWQEASGGDVQLFVTDTGLAQGRRHPYPDTTSLQQNYAYGVWLDGRLYVANVRTNVDSEAADHTNWIMYSETNQPDVIPSENQIAITDVQGGAITGLAKLNGDLVVFMEKGVYRLRTPTTYPPDWESIEADEHFGCVAPRSIVQIRDTLFFAGRDHVYSLGPDFRPRPLTELVLKDDYQGTSNLENSEFAYDVQHGRLLCRFGDTTDTVYWFNVLEYWHQLQAGTATLENYETLGGETYTTLGGATYTTSGGSFDAIEHWAVDENNRLYGFQYATSTETIYDVEPAGGGGTEAVDTLLKTGEIPVSDMDHTGMLRRLNLRYNSDDDITATLYVNGEASAAKTVTFSASDTLRHQRLGLRAKSFVLALQTSGSTNPTVEIKAIEVEVDD